MKRKHVLISILVLMFSFLSFRAYQNWELSKLHHRYETSLAKALKNSYRDIEEVHFANPHYSDKPGGWYVKTRLIFTDKIKYKFGASHKIDDKQYNYSPSIGGRNTEKTLDELISRIGKTTETIKIYYSNGEMEER